MAVERKARGGVPANTNPFCVVEDIHLDDGLAVGEAPDYFSEHPRTHALTNITCPALSQREAESLVRDVCDADPQDSIAVIAKYRHIIPKDMRMRVPVVLKKNVRDGLCQDTYFSK